MKVIVTGSTGYVGSEVIRQAIADERITHVFALTRKPLPEDLAKSPKITVVEHQDFSTYPPELLAKLAGAEACIWTLGGRAYQFPDVETARKISVDYTLAAAKAFIEQLAPQLPDPQKFRFLFCSGKWAEWDEKKNMRVFADTRRIKGQVEKGLCDLADANQNKFEVWAVRPGAITKRHAGLMNLLTANTSGFIELDHLARAMLTIVVEGHKNRIIEAEELLKM
ncbi:uncharacterized protein GGS22DRAFT_163809 [Annulohypoxylon maeteangense]|uniref:uncharacterized protein n=1 Tax=Annulohypoxylon maeteangense TaxID=1927788 RepID=UPI002008DEBF|nr:uncharacterized protein GGS22DRAFT_163809 [Annulohypoxylon maeteangense]KAI0884564.1 hypothetical protein GGS22DRAFT_163809 [Annulohypoxylon maeteangense]